MRKIILMAVATLIFAGCSSNDEPNNEPSTDKEIAALVKMLDGTFYGERYSSVLNNTEHEDITFRPLAQPEEVTSYFGTFTGYGVATLKKYYNDHSDTPSYDRTCLYTFGTRSRGERTISFYQCDDELNVIGSEDKRVIIVESKSSFKMHHYGETEDNALTYLRK